MPPEGLLLQRPLVVNSRVRCLLCWSHPFEDFVLILWASSVVGCISLEVRFGAPGI